MPRVHSCIIIVDETTDQDFDNATISNTSKRSAGEEAVSAQTKRPRPNRDPAGVTMPPEDRPYVLVTQRSPRQRMKALKVREKYVRVLLPGDVLTTFQ